MPDIIAVGEILVEIMAEEKGQPFTRPGKFDGPFPSGAPAIFADQAGKFGASCGIIAKVGADDFGRLNLERLRLDGVDVSHVITDESRTTGTAFVAYQEDGGRKFIFYFADSAAGHLTAEDIDAEYFKGAKFLHIMGCSLLAGKHLAEAIHYAVEAALERGVRISFDPNLRPELLENSKAKAVFDRVLAAASVVLTGKTEIVSLTGCKDVEAALKYLKANGTERIVLKNGKGDIRVVDGDQDHTIPVIQVEEVDPTGAGDCFDGAFLACLAEGMSSVQAAEIAAAAASYSVMKKGPMEGAATKAEILEFMQSSGSRGRTKS